MNPESSARESSGEGVQARLHALFDQVLQPLLATDPRACRRLAALEGRTLALELSTPPLRFLLKPHARGVGLHPGSADQAVDCTLKATPAGLTRLLNAGAEVRVPGIEVDGDIQLAADLRDLLRDLDIDWEGLLARALGELPAHALAEMARSGEVWARQSHTQLQGALRNYLHEELAVAPTRIELDAFCGEVDQLRLRVDRLEARLRQHEEAGSSTEKPA